MINEMNSLKSSSIYLGEGAVIPHGIFDIQNNEGYMTIGSSHETATFIADNLLWWWENYGIQSSDARSHIY